MAAHVSDDEPFLLVDVWFTVESTTGGGTRVHIGPTDVGRLGADAVLRYLPDVAAAADVYDKYVYATGLVFSSGDSSARLQLPLPPA